MVSDLLLVIRVVDEAIHLQEKLWFAGLSKWWGSMPCDLLYNLIVAELHPVIFGLKRLQAEKVR
jgi:hypothetical protein